MIMSEGYIRRTVDLYIKELLECTGALLIEGPKWCGKTRTSEEFAKSALRIENKEQIAFLRAVIESGVRTPLEGETPRLIDEWQTVPSIWDAVRFEVDRRRKRGQFILTGSSVPPRKSFVHSGAGRIGKVSMRTMSLFESGESNGQVSLQGLFGPEYEVGGHSEFTVEKLARALTRGGWPESLHDTPKNASRIVSMYLKAVIESDLSRVDEVTRDPVITRKIIESVSRNISTSASKESVRKDVNGAEGTLTDVTLNEYLGAMEKIFLIENLPAWNPHMRSRTRLMKTSKWHFTDPSIAAASLKISSDALLSDYSAFGLLFESLCVRDLRVYAQPMDGTLSYFGNKNGHEVDLILEVPGGEWGAIEVKLGGKYIDDGAKSLLKLRENIDAEYMKRPSFLMVLTAGQFAYKRPDGVIVVPIGCLRD